MMIIIVILKLHISHTSEKMPPYLDISGCSHNLPSQKNHPRYNYTSGLDHDLHYKTTI